MSKESDKAAEKIIGCGCLYVIFLAALCGVVVMVSMTYASVRWVFF